MDKSYSGIFFEASRPGYGLMLQVTDSHAGGGLYAHTNEGRQIYFTFGDANVRPSFSATLYQPVAMGDAFPVPADGVSTPAVGTIQIEPFPFNANKVTVWVRVLSSVLGELDFSPAPPQPEYTDLRCVMDRLL